MKANDWLLATQTQLEKANITSARLDALVLLEDRLARDRAQLLAHPDTVIEPEDLTVLNQQIKRRLQHEPLAYIRGKTEFYGREFHVDHTVLEPRPESETMITLLKQFADPQVAIADIGTGSGALAITAQLELRQSSVAAVDIDENCLKVARKNADQLGASLQLFPGDLLEPFLQKSCNFTPDVLLCNLPYVPDDFPINKAATHEPALALFAGSDGLDLYRELFEQIDHLPNQPLVLTEALPSQHKDLKQIAEQHGYTEVMQEDFIQAFRPAA